MNDFTRRDDAQAALKALARGDLPIPDLLAYAQAPVLKRLAWDGLMVLVTSEDEVAPNKPTFHEAVTYGFGRNWPGVSVRITEEGARCVEAVTGTRSQSSGGAR